MKKFLVILLSLVLVSAFAFTGCADKSAEVVAEKPSEVGTVYNAGVSATGEVKLDIDNVPILKGDTYKMSPTAYLDNEVLSGATFEYISGDTNKVTVNGNVLTGVNEGDTKLTVKVKSNGSVIATKELDCKVCNNSAIYTNKYSYELYTESSILGTPFATTETIVTTMYSEGAKISNYGNLIWASKNPSVVSVDNKGNLTAVGAGETVVYGSYTLGNVEIKTRDIPVKVLKPYLKTETDVIFEKTNGSGVFNATKLLGGGYSVGKVVDVNTKKEYRATNNAINLSTVDVGDYRFAIYESNERFATEVNVIVADYVIDNLAEFTSGEWYSKKYVALNTDLTGVGRSYEGDDFSGTFNGLGHKITGIGYRYNNNAIFRTATNVTIKNLAVSCTLASNRCRQGALCYRVDNVTVDNVYIETYIDGGEDSVSCAGLCDVILTSFSVSNSIVKTTGATDSAKFGALIARSGLTKIGLNNAYCISPLKLCSEYEDGSSNAKKDFINDASKGFLFENDEEFNKAIDAGEVSFDGFNRYWNLSGKVPVFKSI